MSIIRKLSVISALAAFLAGPALAQTTVVDQIPGPVPSATAQAQGFPSEWLLQSYGVTGGTLYQSFYKQPGQGGLISIGGTSFVPTATGGIQRFLDLTNAKSDLGVPMTAAAGTPTGTVGISRTAGTSMFLAGEATSSNAKTDKALFEMNVATTYVAGQAIPIIVNANYTGSGTITGVSTTITVAAYTEVNGVETAIGSITAAQAITGTAANYTYNIPGAAGLVPGQHITVELTMLITTASGANTGQINAVSLTM